MTPARGLEPIPRTGGPEVGGRTSAVAGVVGRSDHRTVRFFWPADDAASAVRSRFARTNWEARVVSYRPAEVTAEGSDLVRAVPLRRASRAASPSASPSAACLRDHRPARSATHSDDWAEEVDSGPRRGAESPAWWRQPSGPSRTTGWSRSGGGTRSGARCSLTPGASGGQSISRVQEAPARQQRPAGPVPRPPRGPAGSRRPRRPRATRKARRRPRRRR